MADTCRYCKQPLPCDDDCGELAHIYSEQQKEKLRDLELDDSELDEYYAHG